MQKIKAKVAKKNKTKRFLVNLSVLLITVIIFLSLAELFFNIFYPQKDARIFLEKRDDNNFDQIVGWTDYKNSVSRLRTIEYDNTIIINSEGFRDKNWTLVKGQQEKRIIALGDSFTQAMEVKKDDRFTEQLENLLNLDPSLSQDFDYSVLNFGVGGYSTCNEYFVLLNKSLKYDPDLVILFFYIGNDFFDNVDSAPRRPKCQFDTEGKLIKYQSPLDIKESKKSFFQLLTLNTNIGSIFMRVFRFSPVSYKIAKVLGQKPSLGSIDLLDTRQLDKNMNMIDNTSYIIKGMDVLLKDNEIPFILVIIPTRSQVQEDTWRSFVYKYGLDESYYNLTLPNDCLTKYLDDGNVLYLDIYNVFKEKASERHLYFYHNGHLNEIGHRVVAEEVYSLLKDLGLLSKN